MKCCASYCSHLHNNGQSILKAIVTNRASGADMIHQFILSFWMGDILRINVYTSWGKNKKEARVDTVRKCGTEMILLIQQHELFDIWTNNVRFIHSIPVQASVLENGGQEWREDIDNDKVGDISGGYSMCVSDIWGYLVGVSDIWGYCCFIASIVDWLAENDKFSDSKDKSAIKTSNPHRLTIQSI